MKLTSFKEKRFRYGSFSTAMMLLAVVVFVMINLLAGEFNHTWDLSGSGLFSLSDHSRRFLNELDQDVTISMVAPTGTEDPMLAALLEEYAAASSHITIAFRDPMVNPGFVQSFSTNLEGGVMPNQSIIVESGAQHRVITPDLMITVEFDSWNRPVRIASVNFERQITTAIHTVTQGAMATVYQVVGSGERPLSPAFTSFLQTENFTVRSISDIEIIRDGIPEDADILLISTPERDWPTEKADRIIAFLENGGRAFIALEPMLYNRLSNFDRVLASYGIRASDYFIMENDTRQFAIVPAFILPHMFPEHEITATLVEEERWRTLMRFSAAIEPLEMRRSTVRVEPLLFTSMQAFGRTDTTLESLAFHEGVDYDVGPFLVGAAITDSVFLERTIFTYIVVVGSTDIWDDGPRELIGDNNFSFVVSSLRWLTGQGPGLFIPTRPMPSDSRLMITQFQVNAISGFAMGVLPIATLVIGIIIWYRRRHS